MRRLRAWLTALRRLRREDAGSIAVIAILIMIAFMALVGSAIDLGFMMFQKANLRNAVDAASLAGSRQLVSGPNPGQAAAAATASTYLGYYGFQNGVSGTTVTYNYLASPTNGVIDRMSILVARQQPTFFLRLLDVNSYTISASAEAEATPGMTDIGLTLDLTGSMELSGTDDLGNLRRAVVEFINDVNPSTSLVQGPQIAMARWGGIMCGWNRNTDPDVNEQYINLGPNTWLGTNTTEYSSPCADDKTVLTNLTKDPQVLLKLANNSGSASCPAGMSIYACPLVSWNYTAADIHASGVVPQGYSYNGTNYNGLNPTYSGTKEPNAISVLSNSSYYAWSSANGGRNTGGATGNAHKVMVMITDGNDELWPSVGMPTTTPGDGCEIDQAVVPVSWNSVSSFGCWDRETVNLANTLKLGPSGVAGNPDNVEIYVVGFFCTPYNSSFNAGGHQNWCTSKMADTGGAGQHPCPGTWDITKASLTDNFLYQISSSSPGTCDHYFPIRKTEDLPTVFKEIAGQIARGKLIS